MSTARLAGGAVALALLLGSAAPAPAKGAKLRALVAADALARLRAARSAEVRLITRGDPQPSAKPVKLGRAWTRRFVATMLSAPSRRGKRCRFRPHIAVALRADDARSVEVKLCFDCSDLRVGEGAPLDFARKRRQLAQLLRKAYPRLRPLRLLSMGKRDVEWTDAINRSYGAKSATKRRKR
ncbi:MAG: hypothetical protein KC503_11430 [Myxococcales bacterium]|nr:hypothetical protein [Myxococcales bacterium]